MNRDNGLTIAEPTETELTDAETIEEDDRPCTEAERAEYRESCKPVVTGVNAGFDALAHYGAQLGHNPPTSGTFAQWRAKRSKRFLVASGPNETALRASIATMTIDATDCADSGSLPNGDLVQAGTRGNGDSFRYRFVTDESRRQIARAACAARIPAAEQCLADALLAAERASWCPWIPVPAYAPTITMHRKTRKPLTEAEMVARATLYGKERDAYDHYNTLRHIREAHEQDMNAAGYARKALADLKETLASLDAAAPDATGAYSVKPGEIRALSDAGRQWFADAARNGRGGWRTSPALRMADAAARVLLGSDAVEAAVEDAAKYHARAASFASQARAAKVAREERKAVKPRAPKVKATPTMQPAPVPHVVDAPECTTPGAPAWLEAMQSPPIVFSPRLPVRHIAVVRTDGALTLANECPSGVPQHEAHRLALIAILPDWPAHSRYQLADDAALEAEFEAMTYCIATVHGLSDALRESEAAPARDAARESSKIPAWVPPTVDMSGPFETTQRFERHPQVIPPWHCNAARARMVA